MEKTFSSYNFHFSKLTKTWKKGKAPPCLEPRAYRQNKDSCVMVCLDTYVKRSNSWCEKGQPELLRSYLKPQKEIQKFTLACWVKIVLRKAGIDTSQFKAHSCWSAATSKAKGMGVSLEGVLKRGKWSGEWTWQKYYHKPIERNETFETAVLSSTKTL